MKPDVEMVQIGRKALGIVVLRLLKIAGAKRPLALVLIWRGVPRAHPAGLLVAAEKRIRFRQLPVGDVRIVDRVLQRDVRCGEIAEALIDGAEPEVDLVIALDVLPASPPTWPVHPPRP